MLEEVRVPSDAFNYLEVVLREWVADVGGHRFDAYYNAVRLTGEIEYWMSDERGRKQAVRPTRDVRFALHKVRRSQVDSHRGAWLWSHFWMEAVDGVLHQESDWMRQPVIGKRPVGGADAAVELEYYPRDPEWVPEWMAVEVAAYRKEGARERQKAEAVGAAEEQSGSDGADRSASE